MEVQGRSLVIVTLRKLDALHPPNLISVRVDGGMYLLFLFVVAAHVLIRIESLQTLERTDEALLWIDRLSFLGFLPMGYISLIEPIPKYYILIQIALTRKLSHVPSLPGMRPIALLEQGDTDCTIPAHAPPTAPKRKLPLPGRRGLLSGVVYGE
eukprot:g25860.t1